MENRNKIRMMAEGGTMIALSALLSHIIIYQAPNGGSITAGSMIPILLFSIRWGIGPGLVVGGVYGLLDFMLKPYFYHWAQFILDYPLAYGLLGLAGLAHNMKDNNIGYLKLVMGTILAITGRMISHVLSGVIFFADAAGTQNPWIYSIIYNGTYLIPELIISIIIIIFMWKPLKRTIYDQY